MTQWGAPMSTPTRPNHLLVRMPLTLTAGKRSFPVQSEEVWGTGLVVRCDVPVAARQLVKVQFDAPPDAKAVVLTAMVEGQRAAAPDTAPALTLSLYGNGGPPLDAWGALLAQVRTHFPDASAHPVVAESVTPETPDAVHRRHVRLFAAFDVRARTVDELMSFVTKDVSRGGMFLRTRRSCGVGQELLLELIHPKTGATFPLLCIVRRRVSDGDATGVGVEIVKLDPVRQQELWSFVSSGIPEVSEGVDVVLDDEG